MHLPTPLVAVLSAAALALTACGAEDAGPPDGDTSQGAETQPEEDDDGDADATEDNDEGSGVEDGSELAFTECRAERFSIPYPESWNTNEDDEHPACRVFHPGEVELPEHPQDLDLHWAVSVYVDDVPWQDTQPDEEFVEVLSSEETEVDGRRASVHELRSRGEGLIPEDERRYGYTVDLDGQTLIAVTHTVGDTDYERDRDVLDRMMDGVRIDDTTDGESNDGDDPEEVAAHDAGQREFRVTTRSIAEGVCLSVEVGGERDEACGPVDGALDVRVLTVGDEQYVTGIVGEGITEIDMIANDGSAIADEHATAELVEVLGESGYRAFAPAHAPSTYQAVVGYDANGEEVAREEL